MAEALSTASTMELALKDNGIIVDMSPAALLHRNALAASHVHALRNNLKDSSSSDEQCPNELAAQAQVQQQQQQHSISPTNLSTAPSPPLTTFRCERCENFETNSRASLLLHVVQCLAGQAVVARMKTEDNEPENMSIGGAHTASTGKTTVDSPVLVVANGGGGVGGVGVTHATSSSSSSTSSATNSPSARKVFECDVCNMKFSNGANMRRHKMRHTGVKPYECRVCQKRFFRKDHLAEHFTTHTKTLPYHCPICNRGFQRQIAMRAHFQNEHVGQHDLVKTCPLCSYRAGSMKSLRIHFFNRHGIDLDNPGPGGTSSLLLALESQASQVAAAAAAAGFVPSLNSVAVAAAAAAASCNNNSGSSSSNNSNNNSNPINNVPPSHQSDSGESLRSLENATPPMHFLTPHVEIATLSENGAPELYNGNNPTSVIGADNINNNNNNNNNSTHTANGHDQKPAKERAAIIQSPVSMSVTQELPLDCNTKATAMPVSTSSNTSNMQLHNGKSGGHHHHHHQQQHHHENHITPSISLIPIKQEPPSEELEKCTPKEQTNGGGNGDGSDNEFSTPNNRITSLIKVSPLKSLLREDLKRRICAKANNRITRNAAALENNNVLPNTLGAAVSPPNCATSTPICNGTITSTGQESDMLLNRKQILTCHFCGIEFPDETLYFLHKGCHCESNPWKCNICGEQCNNVYEFNSHLLSKSHQ